MDRKQSKEKTRYLKLLKILFDTCFKSTLTFVLFFFSFSFRLEIYRKMLLWWTF